MRLVIEDATGTRSVVPFASDEITLGRAREGNTFRLEERNVSRLHARLVRASGVVYIEDLGSLTGTRVNGERITGRRRLREGDLVEIGAYDLALLPEEDRPGAPPALRPTPAPGGVAPGATASGAHGTPLPPPSTATALAPLPSADVSAPSAHEPVSSAIPAPAQPAGPAPKHGPQPAPTAAAGPTSGAVPAAAPPATSPTSAATPAAAPPATSPTAAAAAGAPPFPPAATVVPAARPSAPLAAPSGSPGTLGRALLAGAVALAVGFGAGWAVGVITARAPPPPGQASAER